MTAVLVFPIQSNNRGQTMTGLKKSLAIVTQLSLVVAFAFSTVAAKSNGRDGITQEDLKEWLGYLASDELEGRATFSEGLGIAAGYIADHLRAWGVKPGGDKGSYFQRVAVIGVKSDNQSTVTVEANGQTRTLKNREGVTFPANVGGKRAVTSDQIEFVGYGLNAPLANHNDYAGKNVKGRTVVWLGSTPPKGMDGRQYLRALGGRARDATEQEGAIASIGAAGNVRRGGGGGQGQGAQGQGQGGPPGGQFGAQADGSDFTTVQRLDTPIPPAATAQDEFFDFLFS